VVRFDPEHLELDLRVTKLLFHINVVLRFLPDGKGNVSFFGGRPDGKKTGNEPAHVKHLMTVRSQTPERTVFEFEMIEKDAGHQAAGGGEDVRERRRRGAAVHVRSLRAGWRRAGRERHPSVATS
jgi:hypothetical protein